MCLVLLPGLNLIDPSSNLSLSPGLHEGGMSWSSGHHVMNNMYPGYSPTTHGPMSASVSTHGAFFRYMSSRDMNRGVKQEVTCLWVEPDQARIDTLSY